MSGFAFPPPASGTQGPAVEVDYPRPAPGGGFIFPPPRVTDSGEDLEVAKLIGQQLAQWGDLAEWSAETTRNQGEVIDTYGDALATKVGPEAVPTIAPLSQAINRRADPTFQLSDFMVPLMSGSTDAAGHNHVHTVTTSASGLRQAASTKGTIYYAFITPLINRAYEQLNFMVSAVSATPCRMDVAVSVLDPASKVLTRQVLVVDAAAGLTFNEAVVTVTFPRWVATQGSYVCIQWLQHGTGEARRLLGLDEPPRPLTDMVFPPKISAVNQTPGLTAIPATIDGSSSTAMNFPGIWFIPYAEMSEAISVVLRMFQDPFTSDTNRWITRPWVGLTDAQVRVQSTGWAGVPTTLFIATGTRAAVYDTPLSTDRVQVSGRALADSSAVGPGAFSFLAVRTTNNMTAGVGVFYSVDTIQIRTWVTSHADNIHTASTVRASAAFAFGDSREFTAVWEYGVLTVVDELGTPIISWADTVTLPEPRYRFLGIGFQRITGASSPRLDHWVARDLPVEDEDDEEEEV